MTNSSINTTNPIAVSSGGTGVSSFSHTNGTIIYNGTTLTSISPGTAGQVLLSNGTSAPSFQTVSGTGEWVLLETITANGSLSNFTFTSGISATYGTYAAIISGFDMGSNAAIGLVLSTNGGSSYISSYESTAELWVNGSVTGNVSVTSTSQILLSYFSKTGVFSGTLYLYNLVSNTSTTFPMGLGTFMTSSPNTITAFTYGVTASASVLINALQFQCAVAPSAGYISLYGIAQ